MNDLTEGGCMCGDIRYALAGKPAWVGHCHCQSCRHNTGSAVATFVGFPVERVTFTGVRRQIYPSSPGVQRGFCPRCGTPLTYEADRFPGEVHFYIGTLDEPSKFEPQFHVFYAEHLAWLQIADELPRHSGTTSSGIE